MSEPGITPLAQRLAEENNVDWRSLPGSGEGGRIVERDVLEYLARVMSGQEATDPTPEPLPEGLEAWPEDDGWAGDRIQNPGTDWQSPTAGDPAGEPGWAAEHEDASPDDPAWRTDGDTSDDYGTPVAFDAEEAELRATGEYSADGERFRSARELAGDFLVGESDEAAGSDTELELSEDIFLFEDEPVAADVPEPAPFLDTDEPDLLGDTDLLDDTDLLGDPGSLEPLPAETGEPEDPSDGFGLITDDFLDDDEFEDADLDDLALEDGELDDPGLSEESLREFETGAFSESLEQQAAEFPLEEDAQDEAPEPGLTRDESGADGFEIDFGQLEDEEGADDWELPDLSESADEAVQDEADVLARRIEAAFDSVADSRPEFEHLEGDDAGVEEPPVAPVVPAAVPVADVADSGPAAELPLANFGNLLRRQLDVSMLNQARSLVGTEITDGDSISASAFLLRAAGRAAAETGLLDDKDLRIAAAVIVESDVELVVDQERGFRALAQQLQRVASGSQAGDASTGDISLAVADMSVLEVDEAILDLGVPMLSMGRILHDEGSGSFRSTLTLSGHFDLKAGARFLQVASELLANPLRLLL